MEGFLNPQEVLKELELRKDMVAADFGSGSGGWVIPLAKILKDGKVYAIDILEEPLSALRGRTKLENINNIETIRSNVAVKENLALKNNSLDLVLLTNILFEANDKEKIINEAKRVIKKGGRILIVDWLPKSTIGPKEKTSSEEIKKILKKLELQLEKEFEAGSYHWGLILIKP